MIIISYKIARCKKQSEGIRVSCTRNNTNNALNNSKIKFYDERNVIFSLFFGSETVIIVYSIIVAADKSKIRTHNI